MVLKVYSVPEPWKYYEKMKKKRFSILFPCYGNFSSFPVNDQKEDLTEQRKLSVNNEVQCVAATVGGNLNMFQASRFE